MNDYDTPEIRCSLRNLSRVTEWFLACDGRRRGGPNALVVIYVFCMESLKNGVRCLKSVQL